MTEPTLPPTDTPKHHSHGIHLRFHLPYAHLSSPFGDDWFALKAEAFARFFGTPTFLIAQTLIVLLWVIANVTGMTKFDVYPFILLNLAFSLQSAYAAPLILLAQTRQADRDKAHADADARHREELALAAEQRAVQIGEQTAQLTALVEQNTKLTELTRQLSERIEALTSEMHRKVLSGNL
ncbi:MULTISPECIES: DUF1003 domain-containing protein [Paraburkholderia]|uniref:DUF1003 domain-containing protein n=1 Tax=Paraburkholderia TaxID=1822464 RepID=UPI0022584F25|nr:MULTISPECIES: DUF1003 domain-containing protein [Paraburkholderia]MCX4164152.1 DUF1003 domain-containing protein [Paraburkholderia megapolitana]MDN7159646.1 DUF1003 domain-containing protein [Paraburkholderia sp. CHISQ3]MDQ6496693.1 DUF1003 domain-containing protein [Paraburkholderia megapolitana]